MEKINETEQWLLSGVCSKCRKEKYCSKPCTKYTRRTNAILTATAINMLDNATGGAYSEVMSRVGNHY